MEFPETNSEVLNALWETQIKDRLDSLAELKSALDSYSPPDESAKSKYIVNQCAVDEDLRIIADQLNHYIKEVKRLSNLVDTIAIHALQRPANPDERVAFKAKYNFIKKGLVSALSAMRSQAEFEKEVEVDDFCSVLLSSLTRGGSSHKLYSPQTEMREWLQRNRPDLNVKNQGKISLLAQIAYEERDRNVD